MINHDQHSFEKFMIERLAASTAFVNGDVDPLLQISAHTSPATLLGPSGTIVSGVHEVNGANTRGASSFESGSTNAFEVIHQEASGALAYWVGIQRSDARIQGAAEPVQFDLRVTEIFRRDEGAWTLIHRHADPLAKSDSHAHHQPAR